MATDPNGAVNQMASKIVLNGARINKAVTDSVNLAAATTRRSKRTLKAELGVRDVKS
jgi:hypothetical protein